MRFRPQAALAPARTSGQTSVIGSAVHAADHLRQVHPGGIAPRQVRGALFFCSLRRDSTPPVLRYDIARRRAKKCSRGACGERGEHRAHHSIREEKGRDQRRRRNRERSSQKVFSRRETHPKAHGGLRAPRVNIFSDLPQTRSRASATDQRLRISRAKSQTARGVAPAHAR